MDRLRIFRLLACVVVVFGLQFCFPSALVPDSAPRCPGDALRYYRPSNPSRSGISPYDALVKRHAARIGMDWRLLSAIIWHESQFNARACSPMSAKGLMQVRDVAAVHYGIPDADLFNPSTNLLVGTTLLNDLFESFRSEGMDSTDVIRFSLASYNSGGGALAKRREEAAAAGLDPDCWEDVASMYRLSSNFTPAYVEAVEETYARYCSRY